MEKDNFSKDKTDLEMRHRLIEMYPMASDKRLDFLNQLNKKLAPIAICSAVPNRPHPTYEIIALTCNNYINAVAFEKSDKFYELVESLSLEIFGKCADNVINWNNTGQTFWFIDNIPKL